MSTKQGGGDAVTYHSEAEIARLFQRQTGKPVTPNAVARAAEWVGVRHIEMAGNTDDVGVSETNPNRMYDCRDLDTILSGLTAMDQASAAYGGATVGPNKRGRHE